MDTNCPKYTSYPKEVAGAGRPDFVLAVDYNFEPAGSYTNGEKPLEIHNGMSRASICIINAKDSSRVCANIPQKALPLIHKKTEIMTAKMLLAPKKENQKNKSPAYTVKMTGKGELKGRTPAQFLLEFPEKAQELLKHAQWLSDQIQNPANAKFRASNTKQYEAICDAVNLANTGNISAELAGSSEIYSLYDVPVKTPNKRKVDEKGNTRVYGITITCNVAEREMPYTISIYECMAPPLDDSPVGADLKKAVNMKRYSMNLTEEEWYNAIDTINNRKKQFESLYFPTSLNAALEIDHFNRKK